MRKSTIFSMKITRIFLGLGVFACLLGHPNAGHCAETRCKFTRGEANLSGFVTSTKAVNDNREVGYVRCDRTATSCLSGAVVIGHLAGAEQRKLYECSNNKWILYRPTECTEKDVNIFINKYLTQSGSYGYEEIDGRSIISRKAGETSARTDICFYNTAEYKKLLNSAKQSCTGSGGSVVGSNLSTTCTCKTGNAKNNPMQCISNKQQYKDTPRKDSGETINISGQITKSGKKTPIAGATVQVVDGSATTADKNGKFSIKDVARNTDVTISANGCEDKTFKASKLVNNVNISLTCGTESKPVEEPEQPVEQPAVNEAAVKSAPMASVNRCGDIGKAEKEVDWTKNKYSFKICQINGCKNQQLSCKDSKNGLPLHAKVGSGHCVAAGRDGYSVCTATDCEEGYDLQGGWCWKAKPKQEETPTEEKAIESNQCTESGGTPGDDGECICLDGKQQSDDKQTCVEITEIKSDGDVIEPLTIQPKEESEETSVVQSPVPAVTPTRPEEKPEPEIIAPEPEKTEYDTSKLEQATEAYNKAKEKEQSLANRTLSAATVATTGTGLMAAASARAEQRADTNAEQDMAAYLATFRCEYGRGQSANAGNEEVTLPGGNELLSYYTEYKALADELKTTKAALNLRPGIESQVVYDKAETGLYQNAATGKADGGFTSLSRALTDAESKDAAEWTAQKDETAKKLNAGGIAAVVGAAGGALGNIGVNTDAIETIVNKFNNSEE